MKPPLAQLSQGDYQTTITEDDVQRASWWPTVVIVAIAVALITLAILN